MPTEQQFKSYLERKREEALAAQAVQRAGIEATAVSAERLTHDPDWDSYLAKLQAHVDRSEAHLKELLENMPKAMPDDVMNGLKFEYWKTRGFLDAMKIAMELPQAVIAASEKLAPRS